MKIRQTKPPSKDKTSEGGGFKQHTASRHEVLYNNKFQIKRRIKLFEIYNDVPVHIYFLAGIFLMCLLILIWIFLTEKGVVGEIFLPKPKDVFVELFKETKNGVLWIDIKASCYRILIGWLISTIFALPIGILMGCFRLFEGLFEPLIDVIRYMPAVAFIPLTILWLGVGDVQKFAIIFIGTFFQEVLMIMDNVKSVPREYIHVSYTLGLKKWEILWHVILRSALPKIWDTFRITIGWAWTYLVLAELVAADSGLGYRIMRAQRFLQTDVIILSLFVMGVLGLVTDYAFKISYNFLFPWKKKSQ